MQNEIKLLYTIATGADAYPCQTKTPRDIRLLTRAIRKTVRKVKSKYANQAITGIKEWN